MQSGHVTSKGGEAAAPGLKVAELEARLQEAEETLDAIRNGDVDAVVVGGPSGQQVYTLANADRPYRVLIEQMQEGAVTLSDDGTILYCNQRFATIVGYPRERIIGEAATRWFRGEEVETFRRLLARGPGAGASGEFTLSAALGAQIPVNISLVDLKVDAAAQRVVCGVVTDLTQNRRRSHELAAANASLAREIDERRRAEENLQLALDAAGMGSWNLDLETQTSQRSLRHDQIFGYAEQLPSWGVKNLQAQTLPEDRRLLRQALAAAVSGGPIEFEVRVRRADSGAIRWIAVKGQTFYSAGKAVRVAGVISDVTDRRQVEEQLRQAQKMEAVGQLTGGVAHDFNNLLMVIGGSLEVLIRLYPADEKIRRLLDSAKRAVARGAKLNQQLLTFSRRQDLHAEVLRINELVPAFENLLDRALGETVKLKIVSAGSAWNCLTDPHQLETAILNLAINARDAMPDGGRLTLGIDNRTVAEQTAARWGASAGDYVAVSVSDTGLGMTPEVLGRAFEPFFTTKEVGKGTGLGLSQVYGFVKQSGGFVSIDSEPGQGTTVSIHLPRTEQAKPAAAAAPDGAAAQGRGVILVVEDDSDVRLTTCNMLAELGYVVLEAESGPAALKILASGQRASLVFSDVIMAEGMNGVDLACELQKLHAHLPVLLTSGYTAQRMMPETLAGTLTVLRKPFSLAELAQSVAEAMQRPRRPAP